MMNEVIDRINGIEDGDKVSVNIPMGKTTITVSGTASVDSGNVTIVADECNVPIMEGIDVPISNAVVTIQRGDGIPYGGTINATVNGNSSFGGLTIKDANVSIDTTANIMKISNVPKVRDADFNGEFPLEENSNFTVSNPNEEQRLAEKKAEEEKKRQQQEQANSHFWESVTPTDNAELGNRSYYSKEDEYKELKDAKGIKVRNSDYGTKDLPEMHDENMHHTHVTQIMGGYKPGEQVLLADNPYLDNIIAGNKASGNLIFSEKDKKDFSKYDFVAQYAATGLYSVEDLLKTADALESQNLTVFGAHNHNDYWPPIFEKMLNDTKSEDYDKLATQLQEDVTQLEKDFMKVHDQMTEWAGASKGAVAEAIECILGKFECTMGNIKSVIGPACKRIEEFKENLEQLKEGKEILCGEDGNGGLDKELRDLETVLNEKQNTLRTIQYGEPTKNIWHSGVGNEPGYYEHNPAHDTWEAKLASAQTAVNDAQTLVDKKKEEIAKLEVELNKLLEEVLKTYFLIKNLVATVHSFKQYFTEGTKQHEWISSADSIYKNHDLIVDEFEDFVKMPVITSLSGYYDETGEFVDYKVGDLIMHDDAHGYVYKVTQEFDPLTGTLKVVCVDKDGKEIGKELTIWDPREIAPIVWVREYDPEIYDPYFPTTPTSPTIPTKPTYPGPEPGTPTTPTSPTIPTKPTYPGPEPGTPTTPPIPTIPTTPTAPTNPYPSPPPPPPPTNPYAPDAPHTGLDALYPSNSETSESGAGLGALAALLAGAAGLGITELIDKKKQKDEEEENPSEAESQDGVENNQ